MAKLSTQVLVRQNMFGYLQTLMGFATNFSLAVILPIVMGANNFGIFSLTAGFAYLIVGFFAAGFDYSTIRFFSSYWATRRFDKLKAVFLYLIRFKLAIAAAASLALFLLADFIAQFYAIPNFSFLLRLASPLIFFYATMTSISSAFIAVRKSETAFAVSIFNGLLVILLPILLFLAYGVEGAIAGIVLAFVLSSFPLVLFWKKISGLSTRKAEINRSEIKTNVFHFSIISLFNLFLFIGIVILLGLFVSPSDVAYFKISLSWFSAAGMLIPISSQIFFSSIIGLKASDKPKMDAYLSKIMRYSSILIIPLMFGIFFLGSDLIRLVYGESFYLAGLSLEVLAGALFFNFMASIFYGIMTAHNKVREMALAYFTIAAISLVFAAVAIGYFGLFGASFSFLFANALLFFALLFPIERMARLNIGSFVSKPLLASIAMSLFVVYAKIMLPGPVGKIVLVGLAMLLYFAVLFIIKGIAKEDLKLLQAMK